MVNHQSQSFVKGALILSAAGLIGKVISAGYRVPLQNITGDAGFYIYQQVYPLLGMAMVLSLYGFPAALSKLVAAISEERRELSLPSFYLPVFCWLFLISGGVALIGWTSAPDIARIMDDRHLIPSLRAAFLVFLIVPFLSLFRGVFQGVNQMTPTAASQLFEQVIRVGGIIAAAMYVSSNGSLYFLGTGAAISAGMGGLGAICLLAVFFKKYKLWTWRRWEQSPSYIKSVIIYGLFISLNYMLLLLLQWVDALTIVPGLVESGMNQEQARVWKGIFDRGQPLIQLGTVLASSLALALIPSITKKQLQLRRKQVTSSVFSAFKFSLVIGFGAAVGLIVLFPTINLLFFQSTEGTGFLRILMVVIVFSSLALTTCSVLQGLDYVIPAALIILGGTVIKFLGNVWWVPVLQLEGAALASVVAVAFVLIGNIVILRQEFEKKQWRKLPWLPMGAAALTMAVLVSFLNKLVFPILDNRLILLLFTLSVTAIGAGVYLVLLLKLGAFSKREIESLPKNHLWLPLLPKGMKK